MPKFTGQTDKEETFALTSAIIDAFWLEKEGLVNGTATLEVRTLYVHHAALIKIQIKDKEGKVIDTLEGGSVIGDFYRRIIPLKPSAAGGIFFEISLPEHNLKATGPLLPVKGIIQVKNVNWKDKKSGKVLSHVSRAQETLIEAKVDGANLHSKAYFSVTEARFDGHEVHLINVPAKIEKGAMSVAWMFGHSADPASTYGSQGEKDRTGE